MTYPIRHLSVPLWRMLSIPHQRTPLSGEGARLHGGRWNPRGTPALYLATDHATAVAEFYQDLPKPGTLAPYHVNASRIADLTDGRGRPVDTMVAEALEASWKALAQTSHYPPPSWQIVVELMAHGIEGALVPSVQNRCWCSLVLWRWHDAAPGSGEGAALILLDPECSLN